MTAPDPFDLLKQHIDSQFEGVHRRIDDQDKETSRRFDAIDQALNGNGQPGLIRTVQDHETRLNSEREDAKTHGAKWGAIVSAAVTGLVLGIAALFGYAPPGRQ